MNRVVYIVMRLVWSNPRYEGESAYIESTMLGQFRLTHFNKYGGRYDDITGTIKGAKTSFSRHLGYKAEWHEVVQIGNE